MKLGKTLGVLVAIGIVSSGTVLSVSGSANAANDNPYASVEVTKTYDGTDQGTVNGTFINSDNGYYPGDNTDDDGVVSSNDTVGYKVKTSIQAGSVRTVKVTFNIPEYLQFDQSLNKSLCPSTIFYQVVSKA